jgi:hypothetical protein
MTVKLIRNNAVRSNADCIIIPVPKDGILLNVGRSYYHFKKELKNFAEKRMYLEIKPGNIYYDYNERLKTTVAFAVTHLDYRQKIDPNLLYKCLESIDTNLNFRGISSVAINIPSHLYKNFIKKTVDMFCTLQHFEFIICNIKQ